MRTNRYRPNDFARIFQTNVDQVRLANGFFSPVFRSEGRAGVDVSKGQPGLVVQVQRSAVDPDHGVADWYVVDELRFEGIENRSERYLVSGNGVWRVAAFLESSAAELEPVDLRFLAGGVESPFGEQTRIRRRSTFEALFSTAEGVYRLRRNLPIEVEEVGIDGPYSDEKFVRLSEAPMKRGLAFGAFAAECLTFSNGAEVAILEQSPYPSAVVSKMTKVGAN